MDSDKLLMLLEECHWKLGDAQDMDKNLGHVDPQWTDDLKSLRARVLEVLLIGMNKEEA